MLYNMLFYATQEAYISSHLIISDGGTCPQLTMENLKIGMFIKLLFIAALIIIILFRKLHSAVTYLS